MNLALRNSTVALFQCSLNVADKTFLKENKFRDRQHALTHIQNLSVLLFSSERVQIPDCAPRTKTIRELQSNVQRACVMNFLITLLFFLHSPQARFLPLKQAQLVSRDPCPPRLWPSELKGWFFFCTFIGLLCKCLLLWLAVVHVRMWARGGHVLMHSFILLYVKKNVQKRKSFCSSTSSGNKK